MVPWMADPRTTLPPTLGDEMVGLSQERTPYGAGEPSDAAGHSSELLADLPPELWGPLLWAVRRAVDRLPRAELPSVLRPFAGWKPDRLAGRRPRRAIAAALAADPVLREHVGEALQERSAYEAAADADATRLAGTYGEATAIAALAARGRWDGLSTIAAAAADRFAAESRAAGEHAIGVEEPAEAEAARRRLEGELATARQEREAQRRRADAAEERAQRATAELAELRATIEALRGEVAERDERIEQLRQRADQRVARLHRRIERAEARARVDDERIGEVAESLEDLVCRLRDALDPGGAGHDEGAADEESERPHGSQGQDTSTGEAVPRDIAPAEPGRPCALPRGLVDGTPAAVRALLQVPRLQVVVDGYNVTMAAHPAADLDGQRRWLVQLAGGVVARFGRVVTVVFDGTDPGAGNAPSARGVRVVFSAGEETADERILALLDGLSADVPVLAVSSDRELAAACANRGANVSAARAFLEAVGG